MTAHGELLVAILNDVRDFHFARDAGWYRIPVESAHRFLHDRWPPRRLAFYQTKIFEEEKYAVRYYADVRRIDTMGRRELFPHEPEGEKSDRVYYRLQIGPLQQLPAPIFSRRARRILFIPTTWAKFTAAQEINDLYGGSPLEDALWAALKRRRISAERQEYLTAGGRNYALDFAVYCAVGPIDIETDGDAYHTAPDQAAYDNRRNNNLTAEGWQILRYTTHQIREEMDSYCLPEIARTINNLGGVDEGFVPRTVDSGLERPYQMGLFD